MRRNSSAHAAVALVTIASVTTGCATSPPRPTEPQPSVSVSVESPTPRPPTPTAPAPPPISIGPRPPQPDAPAQVQEPPPTPPPAPAPPPAPQAPTPPGTRGRNIVLNFDNADIETVIQAASEIVGFNYVLAPDVRGKVTVQTAGRIPQEEVLGVLLAILEVHGFTAIKAGNLYKIVKIEGARERAVPTIIGSTADATRPDDEVITQIVSVRYASAVDLTTLLRPMISARGSLAAHRETNVLIVTDTAANVRRLLEIVRLVDVEVALEELQIIPIKFADANDLATILNQLYQTGRVRPGGAPGAPGAAVPPPPPPAPGAPAPPRPPGPATAEATGAERPPFIIAERRSNSLVVHGRKRDIEAIKRLIEQLDQNIYSGRRVFIYYAENAKSRDLAATLNSIYGAPQTTQTSTTPGAPTTPGGGFFGPPTSPTSPFGGPGSRAPGPTSAAGPGGAPSGPPVVGTGLVAEAGVLEGQVRFVADETTNAVIVTTYPRAWEEIQETIRQLDRMPRQVLIEVLVTEVTLTDDTQLGMDWAIRTGKFTIASSSISPAQNPRIGPPSPLFPRPGGGTDSDSDSSSSNLSNLTSLVLPAGGLTAIAFSADQFFAMITALAADNRINVISNPHVLTSENKKAVINVSTSIPIITSQQIPFGTGTTAGQAAIVGTQSVEYRDTGVVLTVTPRIGERGTVALDVKQEVNDIGAEVPPTNSLSIIKREAETSVVLLNNQTLVLGGLIRDRRATVNRGIPVLKDIPILGYIFGFKSENVQKTELLILITPRVVGTALDAARITDELRRTTPGVEEAIKKAPRQPNIPLAPGAPLGPAPPEPLGPPRPPSQP
jgi:general secretion pathway protein D